MNFKLVINVLAKTFLIEAVLMFAPLIVGFVYGENTYLGFLVPIAGLTAAGVGLSFIKPESKVIRPKEGFTIVALAWILISVIGTLPFIINGEIPSFIDALFETVSGFTTTGSSVLSDVESLSKSAGFWRIFTHFIGGMGVLVFILAVLPDNSAGTIHIFRAESPGPTAQKFVSKMRFTAGILYLIYIGLTLIEFIMLLCGGMNGYDAILHAFSTAGTGGLSTKNAGIAAFNSTYIEMVIAVFMFLFGINFNVFYLIIIGNFAKAFCSEELRTYFCIVVVATIAVAISLLGTAQNFADAIRLSFFQITSIGSTTGFTTADFNLWPDFAKVVIVILSMIGACGGSTCGGIKIARLIILTKSSATDLKKVLSPRTVATAKFEGEQLDAFTVNSVRSYFILWFAIVILSTLILSLDPFGDLLSDFTGTIACIGNVGPGLGAVGPASNYSAYAWYSKLTLSVVMIAGRLEIFPIIMLFNYKTWKRG